MAAVEFIGDEVTAAGYRLCGVDTTVATADRVLECIREAAERSQLILVGSSAVAGLDTDSLESLLAGQKPAVLIVPDIRGQHSLPSIAARVHKQLGMLE